MSVKMAGRVQKSKNPILRSSNENTGKKNIATIDIFRTQEINQNFSAIQEIFIQDKLQDIWHLNVPYSVALPQLCSRLEDFQPVIVVETNSLAAKGGRTTWLDPLI